MQIQDIAAQAYNQAVEQQRRDDAAFVQDGCRKLLDVLVPLRGMYRDQGAHRELEPRLKGRRTRKDQVHIDADGLLFCLESAEDCGLPVWTLFVEKDGEYHSFANLTELGAILAGKPAPAPGNVA